MRLVTVLEGELGGDVRLKESILGDGSGELGVDISLELLAGLVESLGLQTGERDLEMRCLLTDMMRILSHLLLLEESTLVLLGLRLRLLEEVVVDSSWDRDTGHIHSGGGGDDIRLWDTTERDTIEGVWA